MLKVLIVDDEAPAHDVMLHLIGAHGDLEVVGQCFNAAEALAALEQRAVDLMILDMRMPGFAGIDLLRGLPAPPLTIIASAHRDHAVDGFDLDVVDYLLKPVAADRFAAALDKVRRRMEERGASPDDAVILKVDRTLRRLHPDEIVLAQAEGNFVRVWTSTEDNLLATTTLRALLDRLPGELFEQVHKSFFVNRTRITERARATIRLDTGHQVPIGKTFRGKI